MTKQMNGTKSPMNMLQKLLPVAAVLLLVAVLIAPAAAVNETKIGETEYATLADALNAIDKNTDQTVTIQLINDTTWETSSAYGGSPLVPANSLATVTIDGGNKYKITATGDGVGEVCAANGKPLTFKNMTIVDHSEYSGKESSWEFGYLEFAGVTVFENVLFEDGIMMKGESATFTNCSFVGKTADGLTMYGVWVADGTATFTDCTFTGTRGLKMHNAYGTEVTEVTVEKSTFEFTNAQKPGIAIGDLEATAIVTITDSTFKDIAAGDQKKYLYESDTDLSKFTFKSSGNKIEGITPEAGTTLPEGTYDTNVSNNVDPGYKAYDNGDGTWTIKKVYTITWKNDDGTTLSTAEFAEGDTPSYGSTPTKPADDTYTYTFSGWSPALSPVTSDETYTAVFTSVAKQVKSSSSSQGSSVWLTEPATPTPTPTPTETTQPTDTVPTDIPVTQPTETPETPGFGVLAVLAGLGAVAVLRRK